LPPTDKIKRAIIWIRKTLDITEKTTQPGTISGEIRPMLDVFGWDRLASSTAVQGLVAIDDNTTAAIGPITPDGVVRYVLFASVQHDEAPGTFLNCWVDLQSVNNFPIPVVPVQLIDGAVAGAQIRHGGGGRPFIMRPGDRLRGRASPATGVGIDLVVRQFFVDLPEGEYILPR